MLGRINEKKSIDFSGNPELNLVLYHLYKENRNILTGEIEPFRRIFSNKRDLAKIIHEMNPSFQLMELKYWADKGYLMYDSGSYCYLTLSILIKIFEIGEKYLSPIEMVALQYPVENLALVFESIFAEGIEQNILKKETKNYVLPTINLDKNINQKFIFENQKKVLKVYPDQYGNGIFNLLILDMVLWCIEEQTLNIKWYQVKVGNPNLTLGKNDVSLSNNSNITNNFDEIKNKINNCMDKFTVKHELFIITTKKISKNVFLNWGEPPKKKGKKKESENKAPKYIIQPWGSSIKVQKSSECWPQRIQSYITNNTTFLDSKQKKKSESNRESPKRKKSEDEVKNERENIKEYEEENTENSD